MTDNNLNIVLEQQTKIIINTIIIVEYLTSFPEYLEETNQKQPKDLWFIYQVLKNNAIINLTQLFHHKEDYSFNQINRILKYYPLENEQILKDFNLTLKPAKALFEELKILNIRNEYVGHLLSTRVSHKIDWKKVVNLLSQACNIHDCINQRINNAQNYWYIDQNILHSIFTKDLKSRHLFSKWREMYDKDTEFLKRDEVGKLTKLNWKKNTNF
ncbi:hypothetical protein A9Q93_02130 [Nonlabens dokdonensis]|uniref:Uncharacterized protein n=1 Tax=Nonlabens dokdonensis TaxID=328515 RepID=A0A1Z8BB79_9FLAO|nr:hypothetical protein [Nonlabens dokdonensis]OUS19832.1 hypothetical protein A9Q93_02130 [Nonlabens dokdonensis]